MQYSEKHLFATFWYPDQLCIISGHWSIVEILHVLFCLKWVRVVPLKWHCVPEFRPTQVLGLFAGQGGEDYQRSLVNIRILTVRDPFGYLGPVLTIRGPPDSQGPSDYQGSSNNQRPSNRQSSSDYHEPLIWLTGAYLTRRRPLTTRGWLSAGNEQFRRPSEVSFLPVKLISAQK